ncbi:MAG: hypothetical protein BMS9Abin32_221 [Gammaproteobacteria bacterium]|nr:MAG: hypothetical protein BMS9Abin32_221 [Gammaproteobacteria bacterium]
MHDSDTQQQGGWTRDTMKLAVLSWISFLVASAFTMIFFAFVNPLVLVDAINVNWIESSNAGYAIGFFLFWANGWIACWYSQRLIRRKRSGPGAVRR